MNMAPMQRLVDGRSVNILDMNPADIEVRTIAHALSLTNRFGGHTLYPYSVAQHSVYVALRVLEVTGDVDMSRRALLHDASEAYIGDIVRPLKNLRQFEFYKDIEHQIQKKIMVSVGLWEGKDGIQYDEIRAADNEMLSQEMYHLFNPRFVPTYSTVPKYEDISWRQMINAWHWMFARKAFIYCFDFPDAAAAYVKVRENYMSNVFNDADKSWREDAQPTRFSKPQH